MRLRTASIALSIAALLASGTAQAQPSAQKLSVVAAARAGAESRGEDARLAGIPTLWLVIGVAAIVGILIATDVIDLSDDSPDSP